MLKRKLYKHFMTAQGVVVSDDSDTDTPWVHPAAAYFGDVPSCELAGMGLGYTSDECDDDDAGYEYDYEPQLHGFDAH